jgi:hypothetical protein
MISTHKREQLPVLGKLTRSSYGEEPRRRNPEIKKLDGSTLSNIFALLPTAMTGIGAALCSALLLKSLGGMRWPCFCWEDDSGISQA